MVQGLFFDTSSKEGILARIDAGKVDEALSFNCGFQSEDDLVVLIEKMGLEGISYIAVGIGPGSYTGIRKSGIVAMTLCYGRQLPCIAISSLDLYTPKSDGPFLAFMDAKRKRALAAKRRATTATTKKKVATKKKTANTSAAALARKRSLASKKAAATRKKNLAAKKAAATRKRNATAAKKRQSAAKRKTAAAKRKTTTKRRR